jgi:hypothetical protein
MKLLGLKSLNKSDILDLLTQNDKLLLDKVIEN